MRMKRISKLVLSVILSASLIMEPLTAASVYAAEENTPDIEVVETSADEVSDPENEEVEDEDIDVPSEEIGSEEDNSEVSETEPEDSEEISEEETGSEEDEILEEETPEDEEVLEDELLEEDEVLEDDELLEEEITEIETEDNTLLSDEDFIAFSDSYKLSDEQIDIKKDAVNMIEHFEESVEGVDYVEDEVYYLADSREEAEEIADAVHGEIISYAYGVAIVKLQEYSVSEVVYAGISKKTNLPAISPNYILSWDDEYISEDDDASLEEEANEEVYEPEDLAITAAELADIKAEIAAEENAEDTGSEITVVSDEIVEEAESDETDEVIEETILEDGELATITEEVVEDDEEAVSTEDVIVSEDEIIDYELPNFEEGTNLDNYEKVYNDPYLTPSNNVYQWHHAVLGTDHAWRVGLTGSGIKIAVLDSGVINHSDLSLSGVYNYDGSGISYGDSVGHGTMVCGSVSAKKHNNAGGVGIAPDASLYSFKIDNNGSPDSGRAATAISAAISKGMDIINISSGGYGNYDSNYASKIKAAYNAGVIVVCAAGNEAVNGYHYPSSYPYAISVAATDQGNKRAMFSTFGSKVDIAAPGVAITTTTNDGSYDAVDGTSFSSPIMAGEIALILQASNLGYISSSKVYKIQGSYDPYKYKRVDSITKYIRSKGKSAGSGMGKGIVYLPSALNIAYAAKAPSAPAVTATVSANKQSVSVKFAAQPGTTICYTTDGKKPKFPADGTSTKTISSGSSITLSTANITKTPKFKIQAIAVNAAGGKSKIKKITVSLKPFVTGISLTGITQIARGKSYTLKADVTPKYASNKKVAWSVVSTPAGAISGSVKVSTGGKITVARNATTGTYKIRAAAKDGSGKYTDFSFTVIEKTIVSYAKFSKSKITVARDSSNYTVDLFNAVTPSHLNAKRVNGTAPARTDFQWVSSNPKAVAYYSSGVFSIVGPGTAKITATANDGSGKKSTVTIKVVQRTTGIATLTSSNGAVRVAAGKALQMKVAVAPANATNKKVTWYLSKSSNGATNDSAELARLGIKVSSKGKITTKTTSPATIYYVCAKTKDTGKIGTFGFQILSGKVTAIKFANGKTSYSGKVFRVAGNYNAPISIAAKVNIAGTTGFDASGYSIVVTNSNSNLVTVSTTNSGTTWNITAKATGKMTGKAKITIASRDGSAKKATFTVTVANPASSLTIGAPGKPASANFFVVAKGKSVQLKTTFGNEFGSAKPKLVWSVSNKSYASISSKGKLKVKKVSGSPSFTVTARTTDGSNVAQTITISINSNPVTYVSLSGFWKGWITYDYLYRQGGASSVLTLGKAYDYKVTSSNPNIVDVTCSGNTVRLYYKKRGTVKITVKAEDGGSGKSVTYKFQVR